MDKKEALAKVVAIAHTCDIKSDCTKCPFWDTENGCLVQFALVAAREHDNDKLKKLINFTLSVANEPTEDKKPPIPPKKDDCVLAPNPVTLGTCKPMEKTNELIDKLVKERQEEAKAKFVNGLVATEIFIPKDVLRGTLPSSVTTKHDNVNSPAHYCKGGLECIQVIKAQLTPEQYKGYLYGNVLKYMWRWQDKNGLEDLRKAEHYLKWLMEEVKK